MNIYPETPADIVSIHRVNTLAFGRPEESKLVEALSNNGNVILSLVAVDNEQVVGHILFFPLVIETESGKQNAIGLGPMAVLPERQGQGIGSALVRAGLEELKTQGQEAVIVLGHPEFYPRFGFVPASTYGITTRYEVPDEVFMAVELQPNGLNGKSGMVVYSAEFDGV